MTGQVGNNDRPSRQLKVNQTITTYTFFEDHLCSLVIEQISHICASYTFSNDTDQILTNYISCQSTDLTEEES